MDGSVGRQDVQKRNRWLVVVGAVVAAIAVALFVLDAILTAQAHKVAAQLSEQLGRPVTIGSVATKFWSGLAVRVSDASIGPAPGEGAPLARLQRVEVRAGLLRALRSRGNEVVIHSAEVDGLAVSVIRFADGTTNLERLQKLLAERNPPQKKEEKPADLSFLRIDHAALRDGRIAFIDGSGSRAPELAIAHLDVSVDDLRAGKPLDVLVKAAVLAERQNLELRLHTSPLSPAFAAVPERLTLKAQPIDLKPLAPFVPKEIGLLAGKLDADCQLSLGAAAPGGTGPTRIAGSVHALGMQFRGAEGGKPLDVVIEADVKGDALKGDVEIDKLRLDLGPAGLTGKGRAFGLASDTPRIEGLEVRSHDFDLARLAAYYPPLRRSLQGRIAGPIELTLTGAGTQAAQALELRLDFTKVKLALPETLSKAAGAPLTLLLRTRGAPKGVLAFEAKADLAGVDLRPGQSLNKAPGQRLELSVEGARSALRPTAAPGQRIEIGKLALRALDDEIAGRGWVQTKGGSKKTTAFDIQLESAHLDLDKLLLPAPEKKKEPLDPRMFEGLSGHAAVRVGSLVVKKQEMRDVVAEVKLAEDEVTVTTLSARAFGGEIAAGGTKMRLAHPGEPFHLAIKARSVELSNALAMIAPRKILGGKFEGGIDLSGRGDLSKTLAGGIEGHLLDGAFYGKDLVAAVTVPLAKALPFGAAGKEGKGGATSLGKDLLFSLAVKDGFASLKQPLRIARPEAEMSFGGGVRPDGTLDMPGTIALSPQTISAITGGRAKPTGAIPVALRLTGPAWSPTVQDLDLKGAVAAIVQQASTGLVSKALGVEGTSADQAAEAERKEAEAAARKKQEELQSEAAKRLKGIFGR